MPTRHMLARGRVEAHAIFVRHVWVRRRWWWCVLVCVCEGSNDRSSGGSWRCVA